MSINTMHSGTVFSEKYTCSAAFDSGQKICILDLLLPVASVYDALKTV